MLGGLDKLVKQIPTKVMIFALNHSALSNSSLSLYINCVLSNFPNLIFILAESNCHKVGRLLLSAKTKLYEKAGDFCDYLNPIIPVVILSFI